MEQQVKKILAEVCGDAQLETTITGDTDIINEVGLDSLQMVDFLLRVEEELDIELNFETIDLGKIKNLNVFCNYLSSIRQ